MGTTRDDGSQQVMWVATADLPQGGGHPFYERLNKILCAAGFDACVEKLCAPFLCADGAAESGAGALFRLLLVGYFEGLDSERAIAWRTADSLSLRSFLRLVPPAAPPDHSTISRTRRLLSVETHEAVFTWALQRLADVSLVRGRTVGIDATTLEANAALAEHRPPRDRRGRHDGPEAAGRGVAHCDADGGRAGGVRPDPEIHHLSVSDVFPWCP